VDVERRKDGWLVSMTHEVRAEIVTSGGHPPDRAVNAVADRAGIDVDGLRSAVYRFSTENEVEIVVRRQG
jgi:hypothetical protein